MRQASKNVSFGLTARSIGDLQDIVRTLKARGATLRATEQPINRPGGATTAAVQRQELGHRPAAGYQTVAPGDR
jgi:hypothetical protein